MIETLLLLVGLLVDFIAGVEGSFTFLILLVPYYLFLRGYRVEVILSIAWLLTTWLEFWLAFPVGTFGLGFGLGLAAFWAVGGYIQWGRLVVQLVGWWLLSSLFLLFSLGLTGAMVGGPFGMYPWGWLVTLIGGTLGLWLAWSANCEYRGTPT